MSKLLKKTDGKLTRDQQARRYALVMLLPALIFLACLIAYPLGKVLHVIGWFFMMLFHTYI